jgi:PhzF family phenazine biosynthesis protein
VLNAGALETEQMQKIAREINAAVTGFVTGKNGNEVSVRFFMPGAEIAMCGHVTVGLFSHFTNENTSGTPISNYVMKAPAGDIQISVDVSDDSLPNVMMQLSVPTQVPCSLDVDALAAALGIPNSSIETRAAVEVSDAGLKHLFVHLETLAEVEALAPDFQALTDVSNDNGVQTIACFSMETNEAANALHIRDFCPAVGVDEVPASGTTNGALAGYLLRHGFIPNNSQRILAEQGAEVGRPSLVCCEIDVRDGQIETLRVGGQAVSSIKGVLTA